MSDVTTLNKKHKMKLIEDMGINWMVHCPDIPYGIKIDVDLRKCSDWDNCSMCWINALEDKQ